jgi:hypothetical protein
MGNHCGPNHCHGTCGDKDASPFNLDNEDMPTQREENTVQIHFAAQGERPDLPRLMLRSPRTSAADALKEKMAMAKVVALPTLPSDVSSSTEWSMTPLQRTTSRRSTSIPFGSVAHLARLAEEPEMDKAPCVELIFDDRGRKVTVQIHKRPLGAEFCKHSRGGIEVSKVFPESYAWGLGLEVGWVVLSIDGQQVSARTFRETQILLKESLQRLPCYLQAA